jgi:hypothetical protein
VLGVVEVVVAVLDEPVAELEEGLPELLGEAGAVEVLVGVGDVVAGVDEVVVAADEVVVPVGGVVTGGGVVCAALVALGELPAGTDPVPEGVSAAVGGPRAIEFAWATPSTVATTAAATGDAADAFGATVAPSARTRPRAAPAGRQRWRRLYLRALKLIPIRAFN